MHKMLNDIEGISCYEPQGAFYCFPSLKGLLGRDIGGRRAISSPELAEIILERAKVAIVPGDGFGAPGYARLSYALGDDDLVEGIARIADLVTS
jgi:aspartate/methionine/tyrosine aminotransferase